MHISDLLKDQRGVIAEFDSWSKLVSQASQNVSSERPYSVTLAPLAEVILPHSTGVILDPVATFPSCAPGPKTTTGLSLRLEQVSDFDQRLAPPLQENWSVESVRHNYGVAKLGLWYHPEEPEALAKTKLVAELYDYCQLMGIELLLSLRWLPNPKSSFEVATATNSSPTAGGEANGLLPAEVCLRSIQDFSSLCHALVIPDPGDALTAVTVTAELDIPWLVSLNDTSYAQAKEVVRQALESGAAGCVVGESWWSELTNPDSFAKLTAEPWLSPGWWASDGVNQFVTRELQDRAIELSRIVQDAGAS
jgi:tagatose-1,6-bisphosphate aldolase